MHSEWKIAIFHEHIVENPKYGVLGTFFSREISPILRRHFTQSVRMFFQGINNPKIDVLKKIYSLELNENSCPSIV